MNKISSLYFHFPFCRHICNYCDFYKKIPKDDGDVKKFENYLNESFSIHEHFLKQNNSEFSELKTIYIGGGTPSLWGESGALFFQKFLNEKRHSLADDCEFTMELNPGSWTEDGVKAWQSVGVNRFSIGLQSLNPVFLPILDRVHSIDESFQTLEYFKKNNLNYSVDFMLGLPFSVEKGRDLISELKQVLEFSPKHISIYILTAKSADYKFINELPDDEFVSNEYLKMSEYLATHGFSHYEVSNFALKNFESKHNVKYWDAQNVAALGPSATGFLRKEHGAIRYKWVATRPDFDKEILSSAELYLEDIYLRLRMNRTIEIENFLKEKNELSLMPVLFKWQKDNWIDLLESSFTVTPKGFLVMDSMIDDLFKAKLL